MVTAEINTSKITVELDELYRSYWDARYQYGCGNPIHDDAKAWEIAQKIIRFEDGLRDSLSLPFTLVKLKYPENQQRAAANRSIMGSARPLISSLQRKFLEGAEDTTYRTTVLKLASLGVQFAVLISEREGRAIGYVGRHDMLHHHLQTLTHQQLPLHNFQRPTSSGFLMRTEEESFFVLDEYRSVWPRGLGVRPSISNRNCTVPFVPVRRIEDSSLVTGQAVLVEEDFNMIITRSITHMRDWQKTVKEFNGVLR